MSLHSDRLHEVRHAFCKPNSQGLYKLQLTTDTGVIQFGLNWGDLSMLIEALHRGVTEQAAMQHEKNKQRAQRKLQLLNAKERGHDGAGAAG